MMHFTVFTLVAVDRKARLWGFLTQTCCKLLCTSNFYCMLYEDYIYSDLKKCCVLTVKLPMTGNYLVIH